MATPRRSGSTPSSNQRPTFFPSFTRTSLRLRPHRLLDHAIGRPPALALALKQVVPLQLRQVVAPLALRPWLHDSHLVRLVQRPGSHLTVLLDNLEQHPLMSGEIRDGPLADFRAGLGHCIGNRGLADAVAPVGFGRRRFPRDGPRTASVPVGVASWGLNPGVSR